MATSKYFSIPWDIEIRVILNEHASYIHNFVLFYNF